MRFKRRIDSCARHVYFRFLRLVFSNIANKNRARKLDAGRAPMHKGNAHLGEDGITPAMARLAGVVVVDVQDEVEGP